MADPPASDMTPSRPSAAFAAERDWHGYYDAVSNDDPRKTLTLAADRCERDRPIDPGRPPLAIDIGACTGRDTIELLKRGWRVLALDGVAETMQRMIQRPQCAPYLLRNQLETAVASFEDMTLPPCRLINASYTLPFCSPGQFEMLWPRIARAIEPGGRFAGQFFGEQDDWAALPDRSHHTRGQLDALLDGFEIEHLETELYGPEPEPAYPKRWHIFHVVARKPAG